MWAMMWNWSVRLIATAVSKQWNKNTHTRTKYHLHYHYLPLFLVTNNTYTFWLLELFLLLVWPDVIPMLTNEEKRHQWRRHKKRKRQELERGQKKQIKEKRERKQEVREEKRVRNTAKMKYLLQAKLSTTFRLFASNRLSFLILTDWKSNQK